MMGQIAGQGDVAAIYRFATRHLQLCYETGVSIRLRIVLTARRQRSGAIWHTEHMVDRAASEP